MIRRPFAREGFSLIEMMVVVVIMGIVTAQMFLVFSAQKRVYLTNDRALDVQEGARLVTDLLAHDARAAGFMVPPSTGVSSFDGGNTAADRLCVSDPDYFDTPLDGTPSPLDNRTGPFSGASVTAAAGTNLTLPLADLDIDGDGDVDFLAAAPPGSGNGGGIILADGVRTHCAQIDQIAPGGAVTLVPGHGIPGGTFPVLANVRAVPAIIYETGNNLTLTRNGVVLSTDVEDLQVEYWVDSQLPDNLIGGTEFPVHNLNAPPGGWIVDLERIRRVQITVVSRSDRADRQEGAEFNRHRRPAVANRAGAAAPDQFPRRRFEVTVLPRNLIKE